MLCQSLGIFISKVCKIFWIVLTYFLYLRRNKRKVIWFSRLLKKGKDSFFFNFDEEWKKIVKFQAERENSE